MSFKELLKETIDEGVSVIRDRRADDGEFHTGWEEKKRLIADVFAEAQPIIAPAIGDCGFNRDNGGYYLRLDFKSGNIVEKKSCQFKLVFSPDIKTRKIVCAGDLPKESFPEETFSLESLD